MTRTPRLVYKEGRRLAHVSSDKTSHAMAPPVLISTLLFLSIAHVSAETDALIPWSSSQKGNSFTCNFETRNGDSGSPFCYFSEDPNPIMARSKGLLLIRNGAVRGQQSAVWRNGTVMVTVSPPFAHRPCVMCEWYERNSHEQTCLACRGMKVNRARYSDERHMATLVDTGTEIAASKQYFLCRFRVPRNATGGQTAWLSEYCKRSTTGNPMDSCTSSPSYIPLRRTGSYVVMKARIRAKETCRVCMIRVNGELTVGRACLDAQMTTLLRDVKIGRLLVMGIWTTALIVVIVAIMRFIYNTGVIQRFFSKAIMVRTYAPCLAAVASLWITTVSGAVTIPVPDAGMPNVVRHGDVLEVGVKLCFGTPSMNKDFTISLLRR